jgi:hypothetical protein
VPILDGVFVPRTVLTLAEQQVDWHGTNLHIEQRRQIVEARALPATKRMAASLADFGGLPSLALRDEIEVALASALDATVNYGFHSVRGELATLRRRMAVEVAHVLPDAGTQGRVAAGGVEAVRTHARRRARLAADAIGTAAADAYRRATGGALRVTDRALLTAALTQAATRSLHNHVLELVGETLNLSRAAGAMSMRNPPEFALRSEQLDANTCNACERVHGTIVEVGSEEFYRLMPPAACYGAGRCRGIYVFGETSDQMALDVAA